MYTTTKIHPMTITQQIHSRAASTVVQCTCGDQPAWIANNMPCLANYSPVCHTDQPEASRWSNYYNSDSFFLSLFSLLLSLPSSFFVLLNTDSRLNMFHVVSVSLSSDDTSNIKWTEDSSHFLSVNYILSLVQCEPQDMSSQLQIKANNENIKHALSTNIKQRMKTSQMNQISE